VSKILRMLVSGVRWLRRLGEAFALIKFLSLVFRSGFSARCLALQVIARRWGEHGSGVWL